MAEVSRQLPPRSELQQGLFVAGRQLSTATIMFHQAVADCLGLNVTDHKCIDLLLLNGPLTAGELAAMTGLTTGAITAVIDRLERAGFARRQDDPDDRRRVIVSVVVQRCRDIERLFQPFAASFGELTDRYSDKELAVILDFMNRSGQGLHQSTLELRKSLSRHRKPHTPNARKVTARKSSVKHGRR
jgi:DNA-binding MarR family transcriptional regulator